MSLCRAAGRYLRFHFSGDMGIAVLDFDLCILPVDQRFVSGLPRRCFWARFYFLLRLPRSQRQSRS